ncbi:MULTISPECIES: DUF4176 domain-containing protein [Bacillus]|uniref:DUF4176 domain-containing protein n=2 Tax=Bacillus cereus group TaxID=86661 RepID=A0A2A7DD28_BACAN|nr:MULTISPECIES: DUF4176 domain-containing protein [Bacillus]MCP1162631.1 DUF4176 domain-containing protein [Bacillus sp. 1813sda1]MDC7973887.1 DUF4176 domain-containing protein [Bacillus sp. BLCC-B18]OTW67894.1 hypothetical protein BK707_22350 [Bacillus thuringiensis serovar coreanensis]OTX44511.1 hypothetical protein BK724_17645 [Bacillus thuringiensis serovar sooncheon]OTX53675.1 hypothetical protein BK725_16030 [Bacillus thuringiensis serovar guiyangiensis]
MKLFPIGTVVKLEEVEPIIMIIGRMVVSADKRDFDYIGVPYPVGYLGEEKVLCFNHDKIVEEMHRGYMTESELVLREKLVEM